MIVNTFLGKILKKSQQIFSLLKVATHARNKKASRCDRQRDAQ
jgi:hypothetical protein